MKFEIYDEKSEKAKKQDPVRLKLDLGFSNVRVVAVDSDGDVLPSGFLVSIRPDGIYLEPGVSPDLGFPLDSEGRLKVLNK